MYSGGLGKRIYLAQSAATKRRDGVMTAIGVCPSSGKQTVFKGELRARCEAQGSGRDCRMFNLTPHRAFIESFIPHVSGTRVLLRFNLPNGHQVCTAGVVSNHHFAEG